MIDINKAIEAQIKFCEEKKLPLFAPVDGVCYKCNKNIYNAITIDKAKSELITGCPYCCQSYCD